MNSGGYGSSAAPRLPLFLCSEMNFRQILFSETHVFAGMKKGRSCYAPAQWILSTRSVP